MNFLYTAPVYRIGDTIEINRNHLGEFYPSYDNLFNIYGIPMTGFKRGRMLEEYADKMFRITYIVPHPENGSPIYVVYKDGVTFLLKYDAILRVFCHSDSEKDDTYINLLHAVENMSGYKNEVELLSRKVQELEEELKEYRPNPMPELAIGMFGKIFSPATKYVDYFVVTLSERGLILVYENGEYDDVDDFDEFGKAYIGDNISTEIVELYTPWVKSFLLAKDADDEDSDKHIFWRR